MALIIWYYTAYECDGTPGGKYWGQKYFHFSNNIEFKKKSERKKCPGSLYDLETVLLLLTKWPPLLLYGLFSAFQMVKGKLKSLDNRYDYKVLWFTYSAVVLKL